MLKIDSKPSFAIVLQTNIVTSSSSLSVRLSTDNSLLEYCLGSRILRWDSAALSLPAPSSWALKFADVHDPKAKVQPTAADLRAKYIENINRLVSTQEKVAHFSILVGSKDETAESEFLPPAQLTEGKIHFNATLAAEVPIEEDIRTRADLWSGKANPTCALVMTLTHAHHLRNSGMARLASYISPPQVCEAFRGRCL